MLLKEEKLCNCAEPTRLQAFGVALLEARFCLSMNAACSSVNSIASLACRSSRFRQRWYRVPSPCLISILCTVGELIEVRLSFSQLLRRVHPQLGCCRLRAMTRSSTSGGVLKG